MDDEDDDAPLSERVVEDVLRGISLAPPFNKIMRSWCLVPGNHHDPRFDAIKLALTALVCSPEGGDPQEEVQHWLIDRDRLTSDGWVLDKVRDCMTELVVGQVEKCLRFEGKVPDNLRPRTDEEDGPPQLEFDAPLSREECEAVLKGTTVLPPLGDLNFRWSLDREDILIVMVEAKAAQGDAVVFPRTKRKLQLSGLWEPRDLLVTLIEMCKAVVAHELDESLYYRGQRWCVPHPWRVPNTRTIG